MQSTRAQAAKGPKFLNTHNQFEKKTNIIHLKISNVETEQKTKYSTYEIVLITTKLNLLRFFMYVFLKELMCHWMRAVLSFLVKCSYFLMFSNISQNAILRKNQNSWIIDYVNFSLSGAFTHVGWFYNLLN